MGAITGREVIVALKKASSWRTAVACGAGDGLLITSESLGPLTKESSPDNSAGQAFITQRPNVFQPPISGTLAMNGRFVGADLILALAMGNVSTTQPDATNAPNTYKHTISIAPNIEGIMATIALLKKTDKVWEIPTAKIHGFELAGEVGGIVTLTANVLGNKYDLASEVNTPTTMNDVTVLDKENIILFNEEAVFRMNAQSAVALADTDKIYPRSFRLTFTRNMDTDTREAGHIDISEPLESDFPNATLELTFDKYNIDSFLDAIVSETHQKLDIYLKGNLIENNYHYELRINCPNVKVLSGEAPVGGPGKIGHTVSLQLDACDTAPDGMNDTAPFQAIVQNTRTTL